MLPPALLTTAYWPPVQYFIRFYAAEYIRLETAEHFVKQTYRNRCTIAAEGGPLSLSVPVEKGSNSQLTRDVRVSDHGQWRHLHWTALESAYDRSPYFFYYADEFRPIYERQYTYLVDLNAAIVQKVLDLLSLTPKVFPTVRWEEPRECEEDLRETLRPKLPWTADPHFRPAPYHQVFEQRHGFLPNMSIADLLFNMGPEARLVLRDSCC
jgi:hypothetical protein